MKLKPGCGCAVLVLALVNFISGFLLLISLAFRGGAEEEQNATEVTGIGITVFVLLGLLLLANGLVCAVVSWPSVRAGGLRLPGMPEGGEGEE